MSYLEDITSYLEGHLNVPASSNYISNQGQQNIAYQSSSQTLLRSRQPQIQRLPIQQSQVVYTQPSKQPVYYSTQQSFIQPQQSVIKQPQQSVICQTQSNEYMFIQQLNYLQTLNLQQKTQIDGQQLIINHLEEIIQRQGPQNNGDQSGEIYALQTQVQDLTNTIALLQQQLKASQDQNQIQKTDYEKIIKELKMDKSQLKTVIAQHMINIDTLNGQVKQIPIYENQINEQNNTIEDLNAQIEKLKKQLQLLNKSYEEIKNQFSYYKSEVEEERETVKRHGKKHEVKHTPPKASHDDKLKQAMDLFHKFDSDHQLVLDLSEIKSLLMETYERSGIKMEVTDEDIEYWLSLAEAKSDKQITFEEYLVVIRKQMEQASG